MRVIDKTAIVADDVVLGDGVLVRPYCNLYGCTIGEGTALGAFVEVGRGATIGKRCRFQCVINVPPGTIIGDDVFIGPHVQFTNDVFPRAWVPEWNCDPVVVGDKASIGAGAVLLPGVVIGVGAMVGAGSVVVKDVKPWTVVAGNPARTIRVLREGRDDAG